MKTLANAVAVIVGIWILAGVAFWRAFCWLGYHFTINRGSRTWD